MKKWFLIIFFIIIILTMGFLLKSSVVKGMRNKAETQLSAEEIKKWYGNTIAIFVNGVSLQTSVADNEVDRELGLSGTPLLPLGMAKLFIFDHSDDWSFWMKDMKYPIDIVWLNEDKQVIHMEKNLSPSTYPNSTYKSESPALYVIELPANYSDVLKLAAGDKFSW
jgi:uncharacterized membrane protein (UPF0127 family)